MAGPLRNTTWQGAKPFQVVYDHPGGDWVWPDRSGCVLSLALSQTVAGLGCDVRAPSRVHKLTVQRGFRSFNVRNVSDVLLDACQSLQAGVPNSPHGAGGQAFYADHVQRLTLQDCTVVDPAGHGLYVADTANGVHLLRLNFTSINEHSQLVQANSQDGAGIFDWLCVDSRFSVRDQSTDVCNMLGLGTPQAPAVFQGTQFLGGRRGLVVDWDPNHRRASCIRLLGCTVERVVFIGAGCILQVDAATRLGQGTTGPGRVVRV